MDLKIAVEQYIARKRWMGFRYENNSKELRAFLRMYPDISLNEIKVRHVNRFFNMLSSGRDTWIGRYGRFRAFFSYWRARQEIERVPLPRARRPGKRIFSPYIFTRLQIQTILRNATVLDRQLTAITPETFRILVITLYATGMWLGETRALMKRDLDLENGVIDLRSRFGAGRKIPIGSDLVRLLKRHLNSCPQSSDYVFATKKGSQILTHRAAICFRRCIGRSGINREDGASRQPGLRDLRHTFAVNRVTEWQRRKLNLDLMLPRLPAYMGLCTLTVTERYLPLAPTHFRKQVRALSAVGKARDGELPP
jgi:integrase/recombinase XerD